MSYDEWVCLRNKKGEIVAQALFDDADLCAVEPYTWCLNAKGYVVSQIDGKIQYLHRWLMKTPKGLVTDHINGNKLDNRRCNLRICTSADNSKNMKLPKTNRSGYRGISWSVNAGKWHAKITANGKQIHLGYFTSIEDALRRYKRAQIKYHGAFAAKDLP